MDSAQAKALQNAEALALLKLLAIGHEDIDAGRTRAARAVNERLRAKANGRAPSRDHLA